MPRKPARREDSPPMKADGGENIVPAERVLNRLELADMAQAMMPMALMRLQRILNESSSDLAVLQAYRALKDAAYGKDPQEVSVVMEFENLTDEELKDALKAELGQLPAPE